MRQCSKCERHKPLEAYRVYRRARGVEMDTSCNECEKQRKRDWWNQHRAKRQ